MNSPPTTYKPPPFFRILEKKAGFLDVHFREVLRSKGISTRFEKSIIISGRSCCQVPWRRKGTPWRHSARGQLDSRQGNHSASQGAARAHELPPPRAPFKNRGQSCCQAKKRHYDGERAPCLAAVRLHTSPSSLGSSSSLAAVSWAPWGCSVHIFSCIR